MTLKNLTTTYANSQPITPAQHAALIITIERKLVADSQLKINYMVQRGLVPNPNETWEDAFVRLTRCISMVRNLVKKVSHYGPTDVLITLPLRGGDAQILRSTPVISGNLISPVDYSPTGVENIY